MSFPGKYPIGTKPLADLQDGDLVAVRIAISALAGLARNDRAVLIEADVKDREGNPQTVRLSTTGYSTRPTDDPANTIYLRRLASSYNVKASILKGSELGERGNPAFGDIEILNTEKLRTASTASPVPILWPSGGGRIEWPNSGGPIQWEGGTAAGIGIGGRTLAGRELDALTRALWSGSEIRTLVGPREGAYSEFGVIMRGVGGKKRWTDSTLVVPIISQDERFKKLDFQQRKYKGLGSGLRGDTGWVDLATLPRIGNRSLTISFTLKRRGGGGTNEFICSSKPGNVGEGFWVRFTTADELQINVDDTGGNGGNAVSNETYTPADGIIEVTLRIDREAKRADGLIDGVVVCSQDISAVGSVGADDWALFARNDGSGSTFQGEIYQVRAAYAAWTDSEIGNIAGVMETAGRAGLDYHWRMNAGTGTTLLSYTRSEYGVCLESSAWGETNFLEVAQSTDLNVGSGQSRTWECVFATQASGSQVLFENNDLIGDEGVRCRYLNTGEIELRLVDSNATLVTLTSPWSDDRHKDGAPHRVTFVLDRVAREVRGFYDGKLFGTADASSLADISPEFGHRLGHSTTSFDGRFFAFRDWGRALSDREVAQYARRRLFGTEGGIVCYLAIEEDAGSTVFDLSLNGHDGTINGTLNWIDAEGTINGSLAWIGSLEGDDSLAGKPKLTTWGIARHVEPVAVDPLRLVYQVHFQQTEEIVNTFDSGSPNTWAYDGDVSDIYDTGSAPAAGHYITDLSQGLIRLGNAPSGRFTVDVKGDASDTGYIDDAASIIRRMATVMGDLDDAVAVDGTSFVATAAARPESVGIHTSLDQTNLSTIFSILARSVDMHWSFTRLGLLRVDYIEDPSLRVPVRTLTDDDVSIVDSERQGVDDPSWIQRVRYRPYYVTQNRDASATSLTEEQRLDLTQPFRNEETQDLDVYDTYAFAQDSVVETVLDDAIDAKGAADRRQGLYGVERDVYVLETPKYLFQAELGDVVRVALDRWETKKGGGYGLYIPTSMTADLWAGDEGGIAFDRTTANAATLECDVILDALPDDDRYLVDKGANYALWITTGGIVKASLIHSDGTKETYTALLPLAVARRHHIAFRTTGELGAGEILLDLEPASASYEVGSAAQVLDASLYIGASALQSTGLGGTVDNVRVWMVYRTLGELGYWALSPLEDPLGETALIGAWGFDAQSLVDSGPFGYDITAIAGDASGLVFRSASKGKNFIVAEYDETLVTDTALLTLWG